jgi:LmbE family N-acetylglucosaminyl deacetylase
MQRRRYEDRLVLAMVGGEAVHLEFLDLQYRANSHPWVRALTESRPRKAASLHPPEAATHVDMTEVRDAVRSAIRNEDTVYSPLGIGGHPDHLAIARLGLLLAEAGHAVRFYADTPYYFMKYGLPTWAGGTDVKSDNEINRQISLISPDLADIPPTVVRLSSQELSKKSSALRMYTTEYDSLVASLPSHVSSDLMSCEIYWDTSLSVA